jgi:HD-GYP domain-containing protein (c-di-GMP phosphodiesterase class II)
MRENGDSSVIYITGRIEQEILDRAKRTNPSGYIIKPYDPILLRANVEIALQNRMTREENIKLKNTIIQLIEAMEKTIALKDPYTSGHQTRVAKLAREIAQAMELSDDKVEGIYYTGLIHEYGKIFVPSEILSKPGKLTENQFKFIIDHTIKGFEALANIDFPWPVADIILQHHERIDGSGYPLGLNGHQMLLEGFQAFLVLAALRP